MPNKCLWLSDTGNRRYALFISNFASIAPRPTFIMAVIASGIPSLLTVELQSGIKSLTLLPLGKDKSVIRRHSPGYDLGITPKRFRCVFLKGG